jgi:hypothetical protein
MSIRSSRGLNSKQWALLGEIVKSCPLPIRTIRRFADLRLLREAGLVTTQQMKVCATRLGMEALWYHSLH